MDECSDLSSVLRILVHPQATIMPEKRTQRALIVAKTLMNDSSPIHIISSGKFVMGASPSIVKFYILLCYIIDDIIMFSQYKVSTDVSKNYLHGNLSVLKTSSPKLTGGQPFGPAQNMTVQTICISYDPSKRKAFILAHSLFLALSCTIGPTKAG
uniref:Uncharacterized protein n=1 Tax=Romanomermis culicivorax TaxID=13658 RepID=A0A915JK13_ROMCU